MLNFNEMEMKYGSSIAYDLLLQIEKAARIPARIMSGIDTETRLTIAIRTQDMLQGQSSKQSAA
jgi:hypothetical protein